MIEHLILLAEIPDGTKKCCSACFTKMTRRIGQLIGGASLQDLVKSDGPEPLWTDDEVEVLKTCLRLSGRNWSLMSEKLNNKTSDQCKKFFYENRKKFQLDKLVLEYKRVCSCSSCVLFLRLGTSQAWR